MDCESAREKIGKAQDGLLSASESDEVRRHVAACPGCAAEEAALLRVGKGLKAWTSARARAKEPELAVVWTRVRAGISERRARRASMKWLFVPVGALLAVLAVLFYPSDVSRAPFHPTNFEVSVEELESDAGAVALMDRGEDLPRVIWIIGNGKT
jgi:anti-sigma factor RsiW